MLPLVDFEKVVSVEAITPFALPGRRLASSMRSPKIPGYSSRATATKVHAACDCYSTDKRYFEWGGSMPAFKTSVTITPQMKGFIVFTPKMAKASTTLYCDEKLLVA